ncbi:MAG TPA: ABC transporter ATP-binding protein [Candidatus Saccharimonadales bacterium]|nr:ABC transporter ATP-binding protein [Candidatus Saccharimonadales bacterium]
MTRISPSIDRATIRIFLRTALKFKRQVYLALLFPVSAILLGAVAPLFAGKCLAALTQPHGQPMHYLILFSVTAGIGLTLNRIGHPAMIAHQAMAMADIQTLALTTLLKRSVGFHTNNVGGKLVSDAIDYPQAFSQIVSATYSSVLPFVLTLVVGSLIIFTESWELGLFISVMTVVVIGLGVRDSKRMAPKRALRNATGKKVTAHLADTIVNIQTVKTFAREADELHEHDKFNNAYRDIRLEQWHLMSIRGNTRMWFVATFQVLFILFTVLAVRHNPALLGIGIFAFTFTLNLSNRLFDVNLMLRTLEDGFSQAAPMTEVILESPEIKDAPNAPSLHTTKGAIDINGVDFEYSDASGRKVFSKLSLQIAPGEKVGLVGPSGGGKSTLTRLLLRFDDVTGGEILIDQQNIASVTQASLRSSISYVPQEPLMFHRSVRENIGYGKPNASKKDIIGAAKTAHADGFIQELAHGYDTVVGERGVKLSGGQRQRVAIARAILKDAPILILDEATSALDSESEVLIQDALWKLMEKRTAIVVAHRLSTIQKMDRIIVLDDGKIVEQGAHKELLAAKGLYARLWGHQSGGFIEE